MADLVESTMQNATVHCGCGRKMFTDSLRGRGAFRCGCGAAVRISEATQRTVRCAGTVPKGTPCRLAPIRVDPLPLCDEHYASTGLRQYHEWLIQGPEQVALDVATIARSAIAGIADERSPKELIQWQLQVEAERRQHSKCESEDEPQAVAVRHHQDGGLIYFIRSGALVKIGKSMDVRRRLTSFSDPQLEVLATEPGYSRREAQLHTIFAAYWVAGEWFRLEGRLDEYIRRLPTFGAWAAPKAVSALR